MAGGDRSESELDDPGREAVERSKLGAPAVGEAVRDRFSADEVFQRIVAAADEEITSSGRELFFSAVAAGFAIAITFLLYAALSAASESTLVGALLYPLGFIYIIIGGYQLYTENTLPPVALTLERLASLPALFRHWSIVLTGNFVGGAIGTAVLVYGEVFDPPAAVKALELSQKGLATEWWTLFSKAVFAGLIVAGVVWVGFAATDTISRVIVTYLAFLAVPVGGLFHVVVSSAEAMYLIFLGETAVAPVLTDFVLPVLLGNTVGGVALVTVVNYFQTSADRLETARFEGIERRLGVGEWILGRMVGRSYVPILDTSEVELAGSEGYWIMVPIANPRTESRLVDLACTLASGHGDASVHVVHVVQTPRRNPAAGSSQRQRIDAESERLLREVRGIADAYDVPFESSTVITHRSFERVFDDAQRTEPDLVVMSWVENRLWTGARAERPLAELTNRLPCDFLVVQDRGLDVSRVLLPTAGGPDSDLSADVAGMLKSAAGSEVSLLHVVDGPDERKDGERFIGEWAVDHDLEDAERIVDESGDVEAAIERAAEDHTLLLLGATERGLLSRLVTDTLHFDVVDEVDCSVLLAERPTNRPFLKRLFGRGRW